MKSTKQFDNQNVYEHGISVNNHYNDLLKYLNGQSIDNWKIPKWIDQYKTKILNDLMDYEVVKEYQIFHDVSKPYVLHIDSNGKRHFPNHAEESYEIWSQVGNKDSANLIKMDMDIHLLKQESLEEFASRQEAITLLITGLCEIHANARCFPEDISSTWFKIKYKHIDKFGKRICDKIYIDL